MADYKIKTNKKHGGKEFTSNFHFIGKVKHIKEKDKNTDSWEPIPFFSWEDEGKKKVFQFIIETAMSNELKTKITGKEKPKVYPYSRKHNSSVPIDWADRYDKSKYPDDTYHLIDPEWDRIEKFKNIVEDGKWVEVKGKYTPYEFTTEEGQTIKGVSRTISFVNPIVDGKVVIDDKPQDIKVNGKVINYICDFNSPDFVEVNHFSMQIGINSTYQNEETKNTIINAVVLTNGVERSEPKDVTLEVFQTEVVEGKKTLADAFASLNTYDFIEVTGQDNNRATFAYVDVEEIIASDDPFADVDDTQRVTRQERVTNGDKKGLEITSYVGNSLMRDLLTEDEFKKTASVTSNNPFGANTNKNVDDPFDPSNFPSAGTKDEDPFA
ncbi:hypothetical protein [Paenibacillus odorifer]|uniref:hypothetical protein n=1 Tax=Paenibacillus odorifer TaxID=189426 RepID=UPI00096ED38C|nr:hypothetical protein [Paenibacillus odorifer]OMD66884.1 hypothetical protein BSK50_30370 [Paenibacillus odorifer]